MYMGRRFTFLDYETKIGSSMRCSLLPLRKEATRGLGRRGRRERRRLHRRMARAERLSDLDKEGLGECSSTISRQTSILHARRGGTCWATRPRASSGREEEESI